MSTLLDHGVTDRVKHLSGHGRAWRQSTNDRPVERWLLVLAAVIGGGATVVGLMAALASLVTNRFPPP